MRSKRWIKQERQMPVKNQRDSEPEEITVNKRQQIFKNQLIMLVWV